MSHATVDEHDAKYQSSVRIVRSWAAVEVVVAAQMVHQRGSR